MNIVSIVVRLIEICVTRTNPGDAKTRLAAGMSELVVHPDIINRVSSGKNTNMNRLVFEHIIRWPQGIGQETKRGK